MKKYADIIIAGVLAILFLSGLIFLKYIDDQNVEARHVWVVQTIEGDEIKMCEKCGEIRREHTHSWQLEKDGDDFVAVCEKCGETNK